MLEIAFPLCLGIGLSAACGFRIFVPLLGMSAAALADHLTLASGFEWIGTWPAFGCFLTATILEIGAYYIPWLDNALDTLATPAAFVAGTLITAAAITDTSPLLQWSLAAIAGGGTAGGIQTTTTLLRGASSTTTAGFGNFLVATGELILSVFTTMLAIVVPVLCAILVGLVSALFLFWFATRRKVAPARSTMK